MFRQNRPRSLLGSRTDVPLSNPNAVSVVVATVGRPTLVRAVESCLAQDHSNLELIVVADGGGPLPALPVDSRIRVFRTPQRLGPGSTRNFGASAAFGDFLTFLDDDDYWREGFLGSMVRASTSNPEEALVGSVFVEGEDGEPLQRRFPKPQMPQGSHWSLSPKMSWMEGLTKPSLFLPNQLFWLVGGFEPAQSRELTEFFWRLNAVASIRGIPEAEYVRVAGPRKSSHVGKSVTVRRRGFRQLVAGNFSLLSSHRWGFKRLIFQHKQRIESDNGALSLLERQLFARLSDWPFSSDDCEICAW